MTGNYFVEMILLAEAVLGHMASKYLMLQTAAAAGAVAINAAAGYASL